MVMKINIIKAVNNDRFISKKDDRYYQIGYGCKRVYTDEKLDISVDKNIIYNMDIKSGQSFEVIIVDSGKDDFGDFIVVDLTERYLEVDDEYEEITFSTKRLAKGIGTIRKTFSPYDIRGGKELVKACNGWWPDFQVDEVMVNREGNDIILNMKNILFYEVNLKMVNVIEEKFVGEECTCFESIHNRSISKIKINIAEQGMYKIVVDNTHKEYIPKEIDKDGMPVEYTVKKSVKKGIFLCEDIRIDHENSFLKALSDKGITYTEIKEGNECDIKAERLRERWIDVFTKDVDTKNIYLDCFLWHVFSYERLECLKGVEANKVFNEVKKDKLYIFFNEGEVVYKLNNGKKLTFDDLVCFEGVWPCEDAYVVDEDFSWTYVRTHERQCGPYFAHRKY